MNTKSRFHKAKMNLLCRISNPYSILFHIVGIACIIWFLVRVLPKPDRIYYPCQQMSITVASSYIIFWSILWSVLFHGLALWLRRVKSKTAAFLPVILVSFILIFSVSSGIFADLDNNDVFKASSWEPIPNEPIGTPRGVNSGRVVWVWDPNATETNLKGFWWQKQNNNQEVLDEMFSNGIQGLAGAEDDADAWDTLFKHFNQVHDNGEVGYQPGEKIAIKLNLNNCWLPYYKIDNQIDANPYVVKSLLRQLVNTIGVAQRDITIYDAARPMANWFYYRVYYKTYFTIPLVPEFPDIKYVDSTGGAAGRQKVVQSTQKIFFSYGSGLIKTLPTCVVDAKYIINMPQLKRHPRANGVTLSGKNMFGTWIEPVSDIHPYHYSAHYIGNPAPQTDLLAHKHIGGKTILYVGDGTYGTLKEQKTIGKFQMYPFNNDWTNSLFFSQDPVAIDSVMYDFLHVETSPSEGSQNYLHQAAEPPSGVYDPENDGIYLSDSLGVHEHWNKTVDIFSSERYSDPSGNGIDFISIGEEHAHPAVIITKPTAGFLYISGEAKLRFPVTIILGDIDVEAEVNYVSGDVEKVEFYIDKELVFTDVEEPYVWTWKGGPNFKHTLETVAYYDERNRLEDKIVVWKFF